MQLDEIDDYDRAMMSWEAANAFFETIRDLELPLDITDGVRFPWWVFMANALNVNSVNDIFVVVHPELEEEPKYFIFEGEGCMRTMHDNLPMMGFLHDNAELVSKLCERKFKR